MQLLEGVVHATTNHYYLAKDKESMTRANLLTI